MNTDRRTLLGAGAALALPAWMASAFAREQAEEPAPTTLDSALASARAVGKPLLVLLTDGEHAGRIWGEYFGSADEARWLDLALVEVACLPRAALAARVEFSAGEPVWAVVVHTDDATKPALVAGALPNVPEMNHDEYEGPARARAAALAGLVRAAILNDEGALRRLMIAASKARSLDEPMVWAGFEALCEPKSVVRFADVDRHAAAVRNIPEFATRLPELAIAARIRIFDRDPAGARWDTISQYCPNCGMGWTPPVSRYFLRFYAP